MGSEQSMPPKKQPQRAPPVRRGHTIAVTNLPDSYRSNEAATSGNNSPGASICSDSELPYISYTVDRPIGDSPKTSSKNQRIADNKKSLLQRRQMSLQARKNKRARDIVVVKPASDTQLDEDIQRLQVSCHLGVLGWNVSLLLIGYPVFIGFQLAALFTYFEQDIPTFLPIMRGTLGIPGARDPEVIAGLDYRPWVRMTTRLQAHLSACAQPLAADEINLAAKVKEADVEISRLYSQAVERQRANARHAERLSRVREVSHQLSRCHSLLNQTLQDLEELNLMLPEDKRLEPFAWNAKQCS